MAPSKRKAIVCLKHMEVMRGKSRNLTAHDKKHRNNCRPYHISVLVCHSCNKLALFTPNARRNQEFYAAHGGCESAWLSFDEEELCNEVKLKSK